MNLKILHSIWMSFIVLIGISQLEAGWSPPFNISGVGIFVSDPQVSVSQSGQTVAVWRSDAGGSTIQAAFAPFDGISITTVSGPNATTPKVGNDNFQNGNVIYIDSATTINANQYSSNTFFGFFPLSTPGGNPMGPNISVNNSSGDALAVWSRDIALNTTVIEGAFLDTSGNVTPISPISTPSVGNPASNPFVVFIAPDNGVIVWEQSNGVNTIIQASTVVRGDIPSAPVNLSLPGNDAHNPTVDMNFNGYAVAVWFRSNGTNNVIQASTMQLSGAWSAPVNISDPTLNSILPVVKVDSAGNALIVWLSIDPATVAFSVKSSVIPFGKSPTTPINLSTGVVKSTPQLALNSSGDAIVVWGELISNHNVIEVTEANSVFGPFSKPITISPPNQDSFTPQVGIDSAGNATVVWANFTIEAIQGSNGTDLFPVPPSNIVGKVIKNEFLTQTDRIHRITWTPSPDPAIVSYNIFRNGKLIKIVPASGPFVFNDHDRSKNHPDTYTVKAVNNVGLESTGISVTLE